MRREGVRQGILTVHQDNGSPVQGLGVSREARRSRNPTVLQPSRCPRRQCLRRELGPQLHLDPGVPPMRLRPWRKASVDARLHAPVQPVAQASQLKVCKPGAAPSRRGSGDLRQTHGTLRGGARAASHALTRTYLQLLAVEQGVVEPSRRRKYVTRDGVKNLGDNYSDSCRCVYLYSCV